MVEITCDVCFGSRKFRSGIRGDYKPHFTTVEIQQICDDGKQIPTNHAIDICCECANSLKRWTSLDGCFLKALRKLVKESKEDGNKVAKPLSKKVV